MPTHGTCSLGWRGSRCCTVMSGQAHNLVYGIVARKLILLENGYLAKTMIGDRRSTTNDDKRTAPFGLFSVVALRLLGYVIQERSRSAVPPHCVELL
jgi:hypothetical protein